MTYCACQFNFFNSPIRKEQLDKLKWVEQQLKHYTGNGYFIAITEQPDTAYSNTAQQKITLSRDFLTQNISIDELAGVLAHEWGHLQDRTIAWSDTPHFIRKQMEHKADDFAARFLATHGYSVEPLIFYCTKRPEVMGDIHGSHQERANHLRQIYYHQSELSLPSSSIFV